MNVLVICPNPVGDAVMATPAFRAIREGFEEARITFLAREPIDQVLAGGPWYDELWAFEKREWMGKALGSIRRGGFDLAVIFPNSFRSALAAFLGGVRRRAGHAMHFRRLFLTQAVRPKELDTVRSYLELARGLGLKVREPKLELFVTGEEAGEAEAFLKRHGVEEDEAVISIVPGSGRGPSKLWRTERWARAADELSDETGARIALIGAKSEEAITQAIASKMKGEALDAAAEGVSLGAVKALVKRSRLVVATDTGPRHFAVAFGVPSVLIFGPTDPKRTESFCESVTIVRKDVECAPCQRRKCPTDHRCMELLTVEEVIDASRRALS